MELEEILSMAADDTDQWVAMVGDLMRTFPSTGAINTQVDDTHRFYHDILTELRKLGKHRRRFPSHDFAFFELLK